MARTPLMDRIRLLARLAHVSDRSGIPGGELLDFRLSRRHFLQAGAGGLAAAAFAGCATTQKQPPVGLKPRVAIVGAGIAGLHCAYVLQQGGIDAEVFEASDRIGGRIFTKSDILNAGQTVELGGSFIDSIHKDMLSLCSEFKLELLDMQDDADVAACTYYFGGRHYTDREVLDALKPFVARIRTDAALLETDWAKFTADPVAQNLDNTSIAGYLRALGISGWLLALLEIAFVTEYGLDADRQSVFNMLSLIGLDTSKAHWEAFGESDERYKIKGGNQRVIAELEKRLSKGIITGRQLQGIGKLTTGFELSFSGGKRTQAEYVVLTLPFTMLRQVDFNFALPPEKRNAIDNLGYGTNAKLLLGMASRPWREQGFGGNIFTDQPFQLGWDNARMQPGKAGGITLYSGGKPGVDLGDGNPRDQAARLLPGLQKAYPGVEDLYNGRHLRMHWPSHKFTLGSYACYRTGQWTSIAGHEIEPAGDLLFAGEHCSDQFQGYMNGGAETGRIAAESILAAVSG